MKILSLPIALAEKMLSKNKTKSFFISTFYKCFSLTDIEKLEKNGKVEGEDFWCMVKTDEGHGFYKEANKMELYTELEKFFGRYLKDS